MRGPPGGHPRRRRGWRSQKQQPLSASKRRPLHAHKKNPRGVLAGSVATHLAGCGWLAGQTTHSHKKTLCKMTIHTLTGYCRESCTMRDSNGRRQQRAETGWKEGGRERRVRGTACGRSARWGRGNGAACQNSRAGAGLHASAATRLERNRTYPRQQAHTHTHTHTPRTHTRVRSSSNSCCCCEVWWMQRLLPRRDA